MPPRAARSWGEKKKATVAARSDGYVGKSGSRTQRFLRFYPTSWVPPLLIMEKHKPISAGPLLITIGGFTWSVMERHNPQACLDLEALPLAIGSWSLELGAHAPVQMGEFAAFVARDEKQPRGLGDEVLWEQQQLYLKDTSARVPWYELEK